MAFLKPQNPLQDKRTGDYFYPLTTVDQVIMKDGSRLNSVLKHTVKTNATLLASDWTDEAPYTQTITLDNNIDTELNIDVNIAYSGVKETDDILNKAASCLSYIKKNGNNIVFYCLKKKPENDIPIEIEGTCTNSIATIIDGVKPNFKIAKYSSEEELLMATPRENTVGVITDVEITGWSFSAFEPEFPIDGLVWFYNSLDSNLAFNILEENDIRVYPISAKQYISDIWVEKTFKIYRNGAWDSFGIYAITNGQANYTFTVATYGVLDDAGSATLTQNPDAYNINAKNITVIYANEFKGINLSDFKKIILDAPTFTGTAIIKVWRGGDIPGYGLYYSYAEGDVAAQVTLQAGHNELNLTDLTPGTYTIGIYTETSTMSITNFGLQ